MQGQRSIFDPFAEPVDLNHCPTSYSVDMDESDDWNNTLSPRESRLLSSDPSGEINFSRLNTSSYHNFQRFSSWDAGESSSRANAFEEWQSESSNIDPHDRFGGGQVAVGPLNVQSSSSNHVPMNVNLKVGYGNDGDGDGGRGIGFSNLYESGGPETEASGIGTCSDCGAGSSLGNWGQSCKRKALEGQFFAAGSSSCFEQAENNLRHTVPVHYNASSGLNIPSPIVNPTLSHQEQIPTRIGVGVPESSQRHFGTRDSVPLTGNPTSPSDSGSSRLSLGAFSDPTSRGPFSVSANSNHPSNQQPSLIHVPGMPRNAHPFPWSGNIDSSNVSSSGSEANFRSRLRNNARNHNFVPSNETRNLMQDPTNWSLATGNGTGSGTHPYIWTPRLNPTPRSQQRLSEFPPSSRLPSAGAESESHRGHFPSFPSRSSSTSSGVNSQGHHHRPFLRSAFLEVREDALGTDIEGRQRLVSEIRQVLNAMRRGENLRAEDYTLFDPFRNGVAELHDRHRDMRLDVDNMSYEELLALEEHIGNVNTGLSEEVILKSMKQRKHIAFMAISAPKLEPCCICREEYDTGDDIGSLDCGHDFHTYCIKQWLAQKNLCPICKMTGLALQLE